MQFVHDCCDLHTFVVMQEMTQFTRFGSQKTVNLALQAEKTECPALIIFVTAKMNVKQRNRAYPLCKIDLSASLRLIVDDPDEIQT